MYLLCESFARALRNHQFAARVSLVLGNSLLFKTGRGVIFTDSLDLGKYQFFFEQFLCGFCASLLTLNNLVLRLRKRVKNSNGRFGRVLLLGAGSLDLILLLIDLLLQLRKQLFYAAKLLTLLLVDVLLKIKLFLNNGSRMSHFGLKFLLVIFLSFFALHIVRNFVNFFLLVSFY